MGIIINAPEPTGLSPFSAWETYKDLDVRTPSYVGASEDAWVGGVSFRSDGCVKPLAIGVGSICTPRTSVLTEDLELADGDVTDLDWQAFVIDGIVSCPEVGGKGEDWLQNYVNDKIAQFHSAHLAAQVERRAYTGPTQPSLASSAVVVSNGNTSALSALAAVEDALALRIGSATGMIHLTPGLAVRLRGALVFDASGAKTVSGHTVVVDGGYVGASPTTGAVAADEQWIYGSGEVSYKATGVRIFQEGVETFDRNRDLRYAKAGQYALAVFEPCSCVAAKVDTRL